MNIKKQTQKGRGNTAQWESNSSVSNSYIFFVSDGMSEGAGVCLLMMMKSSSLPEAERASPLCSQFSQEERKREGAKNPAAQLHSILPLPLPSCEKSGQEGDSALPPSSLQHPDWEEAEQAVLL